MRKIILSALILASLSTKAQMFINSSDTAIIGNDTIYYQKGGILIKPVIVNYKGEEAWSMSWIANNLSSNGEGCNTYVITLHLIQIVHKKFGSLKKLSYVCLQNNQFYEIQGVKCLS